MQQAKWIIPGLLFSAAALAQQPPAPEPASEAQHFDVREYRVIGNTVLDSRDIEGVLYPRLGEHQTLANVEAARTALEALYRQHNYGTVFVDIPPQDVNNGIVRLRVTEGRINQRSIGGARYFSERQILADLPAAQPGTVPDMKALQDQLAAINTQSADRSVVPVLKAGPVPGTLDLALKVDDHLPLHGSVELNNQYTPDTSRLRATVALSYANLFGNLDQLAVQYQDTPQHLGEVGVWAANYNSHPIGFGLRPSFYYIHSSSAITTVGSIGVLGKGENAGLRFGKALVTATGNLQSLSFGADYKHYRTAISLTGNTSLVTPISYVNLFVGYTGDWRTDNRSRSLNVSANFGPRGLANDASAFANDRFKGRGNYFYLRADSTWAWQLPASLRLSLRVAGQYTLEPLISNEAYSIAGADGVRGYLDVEELGDKAVKGSLEFQLPPLMRHDIDLAELFLFYDAGRAYAVDALPGQPTGASIRSWGSGLNLLPNRAITGSLTWARPLVAGSRTAAGESRFLFDIKGAF